jgi:thiol-disulfide isomerase/thioredoxin
MKEPGNNLWIVWLPCLGLLCGLSLLVSTKAAGSFSDPFAALKISQVGAGAAMPAFTLSALDARTVRSQDLIGKVVLLNFWATWCGPCKDEMPALERLRRQFDHKDVAFYAITTDLQRDGIKAFLGHLGIGLPVLLDEDKDVSSAFLVRGLPTTVLIGRDGKLVGRAVGPRAWDSAEAVALVRALTEPVP